MLGIKLKFVDTNCSVVVARGKGVGGKGGLIYGDGRISDFEWWAHSAVYRFCDRNSHLKLYDHINQYQTPVLQIAGSSQNGDIRMTFLPCLSVLKFLYTISGHM